VALRLVLLMIMQVGLAGRIRVDNHGLNSFCSDNCLKLMFLRANPFENIYQIKTVG